MELEVKIFCTVSYFLLVTDNLHELAENAKDIKVSLYES